MRLFAAFLTPLALTAIAPAAAQDHSAHRDPAPRAEQADPHARHDARAAGAPAADTDSASEHAADIYFDPALMAQARAQLRIENGGMSHSAFYIDRLEASLDHGDQSYAWEAQGWYGGDIHRFWWKSEGEGPFEDELESAELQLLYSRAITPYFDLQAGVRQSYRTGGDRTDLVFGFQGLAPYWFEVGAEAFFSNEGEFAARAEGEYDLRLTQRLILQPRTEINVSASDIPEFDIASGFTNVEFGVRFRYEIRRDFAPYVGVEWESALGETRGLIKANNEGAEATRLVIGLRTFF